MCVFSSKERLNNDAGNCGLENNSAPFAAIDQMILKQTPIDSACAFRCRYETFGSSRSVCGNPRACSNPRFL